MKPVRRALISVSDKTGLIPFAKVLREYKVEIISTGGTLEALRKEKITAVPVESVTGFPEILDGRVKTLHPKIHGGLLFRRDKKDHEKEAAKHGIEPIDLVAVNLYPFEKTVQDPDVKLETAIENIDIGGPSMLRSAAKNYKSVTVVCDPADYAGVIEEMHKHKGAVSAAFREWLALKVFERTSSYDRHIAGFLSKKIGCVGAPFRAPLKSQGVMDHAPTALPGRLDVAYIKDQDLRYGENPHQRAALYIRESGEPRFKFQQFHGKELSYNNYLDIEASIDVMREFERPAACVVKHNNPCGIAEGKDTVEAAVSAVDSDPLSAFGGIVGINRPCSLKIAQTVFEKLNFFEVFVAPSFEEPALQLMRGRKNLRLIATGPLGDGGPYDLRFIKSGILLQDRDHPLRLDEANLKEKLHFVTKKVLNAEEIEDLLFAFKCVKVVKSNAIVIAQGRKTVGIGAGQMSRVDSVEIACKKAGARTEGGILASDAFFPMPDSIEVAYRHGIRAIIQPGGSIRDQDVIDACDRFGMAMVFTGQRHFRH